MSWFGSNTVTIDAQVEKATDESIPFGETDLATSLEITDLIRSKQVLPKDAMRSLKKRLNSSRNPNTQLSTLHLIDTCVKNGGNHFIVEISTREFIDSINSIIHDDHTNEHVRDLALDLIQNWAIAFKDNFQFKYVVSTYENLKNAGYSFPPIGSEISSKLFDSSAPPEWEDSDACMICSTLFSMLNRKHHCRNCGGVFCQAHSAKSYPLSHLGITEPVRVCDTCYDELSSKSNKGKGKKTRRSKHQKEVSRARAQYDSDDDEDLKKALELSLRESQGFTQVPIPVVPSPKPTQSQPQSSKANEDEEDEDMKAAIAASLKDLEDKKQAQQQQQQQQPVQPQDNSPYANLLPQSSGYQSQQQIPQVSQQIPQVSQQQPQAQAPPLNFVTSQDETNIRQFANKVDYYQSNPNASNDLSELHDSYRQAIPLVPKLSYGINDSIDKHDKFIDLNSKIDTVMRLYNKMLDDKIERESNLQRGVPSDPYGYQQQQHYQQLQYQAYAQQRYPPQQQSYQSYEQEYQRAPVQQPQAPQQPQVSQQIPQQFSGQYAAQQIPQQPQHTGQSSVSNSPYLQKQSIQSPTFERQQPQLQSQPSYQAPVQPQQAQQQQQQQQQYVPEQPTYDQPPSYSEPLGQDPTGEDPNQQDEEEEEEEFSAPPSQVPYDNVEHKVEEPIPQHVPSEPPIPQQAQQQVPQQASQQIPNGYQFQRQKVTDFSFPTVPMNKPPPHQQMEAPKEEKKPIVEETLIEL